MNKKIEKVLKEVNDIETARNAKIQKIESEIKAVETEIPKCDEGMKAAVSSDDFATFEKLSGKKQFLQNRQKLFEKALDDVKQAGFSKEDYTRIKNTVYAAIDESTEAARRQFVKHTAEMGKVGEDLFSEATAARQLLDKIAAWAGINEVHSFERTVSAYRWGASGTREQVYINAVKEHPEWVK